MTKKSKPITKQIAFKVLQTVDAGLTFGKGRPKPGEMCVEAAVCYAMGEKFSDKPSCVEPRLREFKINLNDHDSWVDDKARARGLRQIAIAQLGSKGTLNWEQFVNDVVRMVDMRYHKKAALRRDKALAELCKKIMQAKSEEHVSEMVDDVDFSGTMYGEDYISGAYHDGADFCSSLISEVEDHEKKIKTEQGGLGLIAKLAVKALVMQNIPGTRYLYLTNKK